MLITQSTTGLRLATSIVVGGALFILAAGFIAAAPRERRPHGLIGSEIYSRATSHALDEIAAKVTESLREHSTHPHRLTFSGNLFLAHGAFIPYFQLGTLLRYADALKEAGVGRIDINPSAVAFLNPSGPQDAIGKYDRLVKHIHDDLHLELAWNPEFNRGDIPLKTFRNFTEAALRSYAEMAGRYHPEIFMVIHEPTTMAARVRLKVSPEEWVGFARRAAEIVKKESPRTRIGACGLFYERPYFDAFVALKDIDVMAVDIYDLGHLEVYNDMIRSARAAGKSIYIEETWRMPYQPPGRAAGSLEAASSRDIGEERYAKLDQKWLETLALYASAWGLEAFTPFWTPTFFKYAGRDGNAISYEYERGVAEAVDKGERTDTFRKYQEIIRHYGSLR